MRGEKVILDHVTLSFLPGTKVGVVGPNGAGKSTLLRVTAGLEPPSNGYARAASNISVGLLPQEPVLDESKTVPGNVRAVMADTETLPARYAEIITRLADGDGDELMTEMGSLQEQLDHGGAWDLAAYPGTVVSANWSGFVPAPRPGRRKVEPARAGTRRWRRLRRDRADGMRRPEPRKH